MSRSNFKSYICLAAVAILTGCGQHHQAKMYDNPESTQQLETGRREHTDSDQKAQSESDAKPFVVVVIHGTRVTSDYAEKNIGNDIKTMEEFKGAIILEPACRWDSKITEGSPIEEQAEDVVAEIKVGIKELPKDIPIHLIGYSQGGMVASIIARDYSEEFNIKSLISIHAPLSGADAFNNGFCDVKELKRKAGPGLKVIGCPDPFWRAYGAGFGLNPPSYLKWITDGLVRVFRGKTDGIKNMRTNSQCVKDIQQFIRKDNQKIPVLLMAGLVHEKNLTENFRYIQTSDNIKKVEDAMRSYSKFTTREENGRHDMLVSLKSQLCRTGSFNNLDYISSAYQADIYPPNTVSIYIAENEPHTKSFMAALMTTNMINCRRVFDSEKSMSVIKGFLQKNAL